MARLNPPAVFLVHNDTGVEINGPPMVLDILRRKAGPDRMKLPTKKTEVSEKTVNQVHAPEILTREYIYPGLG
jgi:hypothetical protein